MRKLYLTYGRTEEAKMCSVKGTGQPSLNLDSAPLPAELLAVLSIKSVAVIVPTSSGWKED